MTTPIVELHNLIKTYKGKPEPAVADISFTLQSGEIVALLGPNGAGKTTTIKMLLGLIAPTSGRVLVCGYDTAVEWQRQRAAKHVGAVLEGSRNVYWRLSAAANLRYFGTLRGVPGPLLRERSDYWLAQLSLQEVAHKEVRLFSRGMQQKVAIAVALLHDPDVLLLDEPTLGLDVQAAKTLEQAIATLAEQGKTILITTHTMSLAERLAHRIIVMNNGREVAQGTTQTLRQRFTAQNVVEIKVTGFLPTTVAQKIAACFPEVDQTENGNDTYLRWSNPFQRHVIQLLAVLDEAGCTVPTVQRREASLEEMFLSLVEEAAA